MTSFRMIRQQELTQNQKSTRPSISGLDMRFALLRRGIALLTRGERWTAVGIFVLMMIAGILESAVVALVVPLVYAIVDPSRMVGTVIGRLLLEVTGTSSLDQIFGFVALAIVALLIVAAIATSVTSYLAERHSANCRDRMARQLLTSCVEVPYLWITRQNTSVLVRQIYDDVRIWRKEFIHSLLMMLQCLIMIAAPTSVAIAIAPSEGLLALLVVAVVASSIVLVLRRRIVHIADASRLASNQAVRSVTQILGGMREIRISGRTSFFIDQFDRYHRRFNALGITSRMLGSAPAAIMNFLGQVAFIATALILWMQGTPGSEVAAQLALIGVVVSRVVPAFSRLASQTAVMFRSAPTVKALLALIDDIEYARKNANKVRGGSRPIPIDWKTLTLDNVSFRYPGLANNSIDRVSIALERGQTYGFVGRSGSGKTTLTNIILGLLDPTLGSVRIGGEPITNFDLDDWQRRFGYVPQDVFIWDGTLRENITFGTPDAESLPLGELIRRARLDDVVQGLEGGLDVMVGERGRRFSGGQIQRLAIARALHRNPEILFLDEATSALDSITEAEIQKSIEALDANTMVLIIAHRVATLRTCDRIFVLDKGQIIAAGTYTELLEKSEIFRGLAAESTVTVTSA
jgi:ABC-type multidrug transport system fused ATPase/permease subunit